jgi:hypothetical protein
MKWQVRESPSLDPSTNDRKFYRWSWMGDVSPTRPQHSKALLMIDVHPGMFGDEKGSYILTLHIGRGDGGYTPLGARQLEECQSYLDARLVEYEAELVRCGWTKGTGRCWTPPTKD